MRLGWTTDIHLDFLRHDDRQANLAAVRSFIVDATRDVDALVITGDISNAPMLSAHLMAIDFSSPVPVYFVLGNHDYYGGTIVSVRDTVAKLSKGLNRTRYLPDFGPVYLTGETCLVGVDGWADARCGNPATPVFLNDFRLIDDLADEMEPGSVLGWRKGVPRDRIHAKLRAIAEAETVDLRRLLSRVVPNTNLRRIIVATHVPPFREAAYYAGKVSGDDWTPYFVNITTGNMLAAFADEHPDLEITVLCGHTHGEAVTRILPNLEVRLAPAEYRKPQRHAVLEVE